MPAPGGLAWVPAYVAASFFLFCNVFRTLTRLELLSAATLIATLFLELGDLVIDWPRVLAITEALRAAIVAWHVTSGEYRGAFCSPSSTR